MLQPTPWGFAPAVAHSALLRVAPGCARPPGLPAAVIPRGNTERPILRLALQEYTAAHGLRVPIEVETRTLGEVQQVLALLRQDPGIRVDRIMLDNMTRLDASKPGVLLVCHAAPGPEHIRISRISACTSVALPYKTTLV